MRSLTGSGSRNGGRQVRRALVTSLAGTLLAALGTALGLALAVPALATADEAAHIDYAYQLWTGRFPVFEEGVGFVRGQDLPLTAKVGSAQWASHHPPLFYGLAAPLVGPPAERGDWVQAVLAGRAVTVSLTGGCVLAMAWAGSLAVRRHRAVWGAATAAVATSLPVFVRDSATAYNDVLSVLTVTLSLGVGALVLRHGLTPARVGAAAVVAALGASSRVSYGITLVLLICALVVAALLHPGRSEPRARARARLTRAGRGAFAATFVLAVAVLTSAWFYLRNQRLTGHLTGGRPEWAREHLGRVESDLLDVLTGQDYWVVYSDWFLRAPFGDLQWVTYAVSGALVASAAAAIAVRLLGRSVDRYGIAVDLLLAAQFGAVLAVQAVYRIEGGGLGTRYVLSALLPLAVLLVAGVLAWRWGKRLWLATGLVALLAGGSWLTVFTRFDLAQVVAVGRTPNDMPSAVVLAAFVVAGVGVVLQSAGLVALGRAEGRTTPEVETPAAEVRRQRSPAAR